MEVNEYMHRNLRNAAIMAPVAMGLSLPVSISPTAIDVAGLKFETRIGVAATSRLFVSSGPSSQRNANCLAKHRSPNKASSETNSSWPFTMMRSVATGQRRLHIKEGNLQKCTCSAESPPEGGNVIVEEDPYTETESEEVARERNWKVRGWAPWEELRTPEAQFALDSLIDNGEQEDPMVSWEAFENLDKNQQKEEEPVMTGTTRSSDDEGVAGRVSDGPAFVTLIPPRDWPPPGWKVDAKELAYIREAYVRKPEFTVPMDLDDESNFEAEDATYKVPRWETFLKQYKEWVAVNKPILDQEIREMEEEYYPGRRKTGAEYQDGMYELPFIYPGQHYWGIVTYVNLYEGAFVDFGGVHDGWIPVMDNDWYEVRHHIKLGMLVHVEVLAKRDPYRFRFPVEMRFVEPHIDHLIFKRFKYPPIFGRKEDTNLDEVSREANRPFYLKVRPELTPEEKEDAKVAAVHPYVQRLWVVHEAEQMTLDSEDGLTDDEDWDDWATEEEDDPTGEWATEPGLLTESDEGVSIPTVVLHIEDKYMDLEAAREERKGLHKMGVDAEMRGEVFEQPESRFEKRMKELNHMHQQRWSEQQAALVRDISCRLELGLPIEEPGRYADKSFWGKTQYDPREPEWRNDYWGDPAKMKDDYRKEQEPRVRSTTAAADEEEEEGMPDWDLRAGEEESESQLSQPGQAGINYDDPDVRLVFRETENVEGVNGTLTRTLINPWDGFDLTKES